MPTVFDRTLIQANMQVVGPKDKTRCGVFLDTINHLEDEKNYEKIRTQAKNNLTWWEISAPESKSKPTCQIEVHPGDWGVVTRRLTQKYGKIFAVLNMANAYGPGGGVEHGMVAQEENMFRRTDCYKSITANEVGPNHKQLRYTPAMTQLINGLQGAVYLDTDSYRVCFKGPETNEYALLADQDIFPFYKLRSAAMDCRGMVFNEQTTRQKIQAQLATLKQKGVRNAILSAFGCGAFNNPPEVVAQLYKEELEKMKDDFDHIAFAIFNAGYDRKNNFEIFKKTLAPQQKIKKPSDPTQQNKRPRFKKPKSTRSFLSRHWGKLLASTLGVIAIILASTLLTAGLALAFWIGGSILIGLSILKAIAEKVIYSSVADSDSEEDNSSGSLKSDPLKKLPSKKLPRSPSFSKQAQVPLFKSVKPSPIKKSHSSGALPTLQPFK